MGFSRRQKRVLGALSIWPAVGTALFVALWLANFFFIDPSSTAWMIVFWVGFTVGGITIPESLALALYYVVWMGKQPVPEDRKIVWILFMFLAGAIALPIFWFLHVLRERPLAAPPPVYVQGWQQPPG